MVSSTRLVNSSAAVLSDAQNGQLVLRILGSRRAGQVVRLTSDKCTIGSGPRCTLRLVARGVKPLHCLILRGSARTAVRCWAPDTRLNGRAFRDAELKVGDRLAVGPVELEVLDSRDTQLETLDTTTDLSNSKPAEQRNSRDVANRQGRRRARQLIQRLREAKQRIAALEVRRDNPSSESPATETNRELQLEADREAFEHKCQAWEIARIQAEEELGRRASLLDASRAELTTERDAVSDERDDWEAVRTEAEKYLADRAGQLDHRETDLDRRAPMFDQLTAMASGSSVSHLSGPAEETDGGAESLARSAEDLPRQSMDSAADADEDDGESVDEYMNRLLEGVLPDESSGLPPEELRAIDTADDPTIGGSDGESEPVTAEVVVDSTSSEEDEPPLESDAERPTASKKSAYRDREARLLAESRNPAMAPRTTRQDEAQDNLLAKLGLGWLVAVGVMFGVMATGFWWLGWLSSIAFYALLAGLWLAFAWLVHTRVSDPSEPEDSP